MQPFTNESQWTDRITKGWGFDNATSSASCAPACTMRSIFRVVFLEHDADSWKVVLSMYTLLNFVHGTIVL